LETPELEGRPSAPYVIEALLTYVRGVETGAFGAGAFERFTTITRCRLEVRHETSEDERDAD